MPASTAPNAPNATRRASPRFTGVSLLHDNEEAWAAKRHLIATARRRLDLSYFILDTDASTSRLMLDLIEAGQRRVKVRLMVDYFTTFKQAPALRLLGQQSDIEVRRYGAPTAVWLGALKDAGINPRRFVTALMAADGAGLAEALEGNTLFDAQTLGRLTRLRPEPGEAAQDFSQRVLAELPAASHDTQPDVPPMGIAASREYIARKAAIALHIVTGLKKFLHRNHHKLLLADRRRFIMGGRNLADAYHCSKPALGHPFQDTDLMARDGHAGGSPHLAAFEQLWNSALAVDIRLPDPLDPRSPMAIDDVQQAAQPVPPRRPGAHFQGGTALPDMDGQFVDNLPSDHGDPSITRTYAARLSGLIEARRPAVVDIVSAYLCPADHAIEGENLLALRDTLMAAAAAGITVNIYTNSLDSTDLKPVNHAAYPRLVKLLQADVRIFELGKGQGSLHSKSAAFGDDCLIVGSYNMDLRSELYDTNNLVVLEDLSGRATETFRLLCIRRLRWDPLSVETAQALAGDPNSRSKAAMLVNPIL